MCCSKAETEKLVHLAETGIKNWAKALRWGVKGYFLKYNCLGKNANNNSPIFSNRILFLKNNLCKITDSLLQNVSKFSLCAFQVTPDSHFPSSSDSII